MKKAVITLVVMLCVLVMAAQTEKIEKKILSERIAQGKIPTDKATEVRDKWYKLMGEFGGYPNLPYNEEKGIVEFEHIKEFPGMDKKTIYNRVLEWSAINFGSLGAVLNYENFETGKIILKGFTYIHIKEDMKGFFMTSEKIRSIRVKVTYVFTVKEGKLKIYYTGIEYEVPYYAVASNTLSYSDESISAYYPIVESEEINWKGRLSLLKETNIELTATSLRLCNYILDSAKDNGF